MSEGYVKCQAYEMISIETKRRAAGKTVRPSEHRTPEAV